MTSTVYWTAAKFAGVKMLNAFRQPLINGSEMLLDALEFVNQALDSSYRDSDLNDDAMYLSGVGSSQEVAA